MARTPLTSARATAIGPYSHGVDTGSLVFCSGQTPLDPETGKLRDGGVGAQTSQCFENLFAVLESGGLGPADVVKVNVYLTDMGDFAEMNDVYATRFDQPFPARTTLAVAGLPLGAAIEIELIAQHP